MKCNGIYEMGHLCPGSVGGSEKDLAKFLMLQGSLLGVGQGMGPDPMVHVQFLSIRQRDILQFSLVNSTTTTTTAILPLKCHLPPLLLWSTRLLSNIGGLVGVGTSGTGGSGSGGTLSGGGTGLGRRDVERVGGVGVSGRGGKEGE
jgi:hypothetical protein